MRDRHPRLGSSCQIHLFPRIHSPDASWHLAQGEGASGEKERAREKGKKDGRKGGSVEKRGIETRGTPVTVRLIPIESVFHLAGQERERSFAREIRHTVQILPYSARVRP